jgi:hypothetical protein
MKRTIKLLIFVVLCGLTFGFQSCSKDKGISYATLQVKLTDAPANYDQVLIDIQDVQVNLSDSSDENGWSSLGVSPGVFNLLDFRNGMDTLLAQAELPAGKISQIRLVLGTGNQVNVDGVLHDMNTPSGEQSGLKLNLHTELTAGITYTLWIDFDAARSVVKKGNGTYSLKPVIRAFSNPTSGAIAGIVDPAESLSYLFIVNSTDTIGTMASQEGSFLLRGVPEGTYTLNINPTVGDIADKTIDGIVVTLGEQTNLGTIHIE